MKDPGEGATSRGVTNLRMSEVDMDETTCLAPDCDAEAKVRGLCRRHYGRWYDATDGYHDYAPLPKQTKPPRSCEIQDCQRPYLAKGMCSAHYAHQAKYGTPHRRPPACSHCGASPARGDFIYELGNYCSAECHKAAQMKRRADRRELVRQETFQRLSESAPIKCGGCKAVRPALDYLGVHGRQTKRCSHCREVASTYRSIGEARDLMLQRTYGINAAEYDALFAEQRGLCAICERPEVAVRNGRTARLAVDHCHDTGKVRGLLCLACNIGLGKFRDDPARLTRAIDYLKLHSD